MSPRKRSRAPKGLVWRAGRAYFDRRHSQFTGGRLAISLRTSDPDVATERHTVLTQLMDRGDWGVLEAIRSGDMHISDAQAALRNGDATKLRRMGSDSPRLGLAVERFLQLKEATRSQATIKRYRTVLGNLERDVGSDFPMEELTVDEARAYLHGPKASTAGRPWAPASQGACQVVCGALWSMVMAEEADLLARRNVQPAIRSNPWKGVEMPEIRPTRAVFLTPPEWVDLDRGMVGIPSRAMIAIAFSRDCAKARSYICAPTWMCSWRATNRSSASSPERMFTPGGRRHGGGKGMFRSPRAWWRSSTTISAEGMPGSGT